MKALLLLVAAAAAGFAVGVSAFTFTPQPGEETGELESRLRGLEREVAELEEQPRSPPAYEHWERFENHLDVYGRVDLSRLPSDRSGRPGFGGEQWGGVMSGPTLDLLLAARIAQTLAPVYFDRVAFKDGAGRMSFYVLGARED